MPGGMKVLVIGAGGIGSIYSLLLRLGDPDAEISLVARSNHDVLKQSGIAITSAKYGDHHFIPDAVYKSGSEAAEDGRTFDYVFPNHKVLAECPAVPLLKPVVSPHTTIVLIQNGLGIEAPVHAAFPENTLISCTAYIGVWQTAPGKISHSALDRLEMGSYPDLEQLPAERQNQDQTSLAKIVKVLGQGGCDIKIVPSMPSARWQKLIWNASFNCVCTITGLNTAEVISTPSAETMVLEAMREIVKTANAAGYALPETLIQANWDNTAKMGVAYKPSMMLDSEANREMELDVILGAPIEQANRLGIDVPTLKEMKASLDVRNQTIAKTASIRS